MGVQILPALDMSSLLGLGDTGQGFTAGQQNTQNEIAGRNVLGNPGGQGGLLKSLLGIGPDADTIARERQAMLAQQHQQQLDTARNAALLNPSAQNFERLFLLDPASREAIKDAHATLDAESQRAELQHWSALRGYANASDPEGFRAEAQRRLDADKAAGRDIAEDQHVLAMADNPQGLRALGGFFDSKIAAVLGPEKWAQGFEPTEKAATAAETERHNRADEDKPLIAPAGSAILGRDGQGSVETVPSGANPDGHPPVAAPTSAEAPPKDLDAMARMIVSEAGGEGPQGMAAAAHVALNRLRIGYGGARTLGDVVHAPHQFEGMTTSRANVSPDNPVYQEALQIASGVISGAIPDPTGGATNFVNPQLQARLGRKQPDWASGNGLRIGNHVFYGGANGGGNAQPYQVAANGPTPPPPSAAPPGWHVIGNVPTKPDNAPSGYRWTAEGNLEAIPGGPAAPGGADAPINGLTGEAYLAALPKGQQPIVKALSEGRLAFPTGKALTSPYWQGMIQAVGQYDPSFDQANPQSRARTRVDFTSGKSAQNITALNTVIGHLDDLDRSITGLGNYSWPLNNTVAHIIARGTGTDARLNRFATAKTAVANELTRVFRGTGGAEADIQAWQKQLDASSSPQALRATVQAMAELIKSRLDALGEQYQQGMGVSRDPISLLTPDKQRMFARMDAGIAPESADRAPKASGVPSGAPTATGRDGHKVWFDGHVWRPVQ